MVQTVKYKELLKPSKNFKRYSAFEKFPRNHPIKRLLKRLSTHTVTILIPYIDFYPKFNLISFHITLTIISLLYMNSLQKFTHFPVSKESSNLNTSSDSVMYQFVAEKVFKEFQNIYFVYQT